MLTSELKNSSKSCPHPRSGFSVALPGLLAIVESPIRNIRSGWGGAYCHEQHRNAATQSSPKTCHGFICSRFNSVIFFEKRRALPLVFVAGTVVNFGPVAMPFRKAGQAPGKHEVNRRRCNGVVVSGRNIDGHFIKNVGVHIYLFFR